MTKYIVQGGQPLFGEVRISGAKNAAVAIIPAALLVDGVCRIENIPQISDVTALLKILEQLGAKVDKVVCLLELKGLHGRDRIKTCPAETVVAYEGK